MQKYVARLLDEADGAVLDAATVNMQPQSILFYFSLALSTPQTYVARLLDEADGAVSDAATIEVQLARVAGILATDINNTDITAQIQVRP